MKEDKYKIIEFSIWRARFEQDNDACPFVSVVSQYVDWLHKQGLDIKITVRESGV